MNVCARVCLWVIGGWVCGYGGMDLDYSWVVGG